MFGEIDYSREGDDLLQEITVENVTDVRTDRLRVAVEFFVCDPHVPEGFRIGTVNIEGTPRQLREAIAKDIPAILRDLEIRVSASRRAALPPYRVGRSISGAELAVARVVRSGRKRR